MRWHCIKLELNPLPFMPPFQVLFCQATAGLELSSQCYFHTSEVRQDTPSSGHLI